MSLSLLSHKLENKYKKANIHHLFEEFKRMTQARDPVDEEKYQEFESKMSYEKEELMREFQEHWDVLSGEMLLLQSFGSKFKAIHAMTGDELYRRLAEICYAVSGKYLENRRV